jgi:hypothetical protein
MSVAGPGYAYSFYPEQNSINYGTDHTLMEDFATELGKVKTVMGLLDNLYQDKENILGEFSKIPKEFIRKVEGKFKDIRASHPNSASAAESRKITRDTLSDFINEYQRVIASYTKPRVAPGPKFGAEAFAEDLASFEKFLKAHTGIEHASERKKAFNDIRAKLHPDKNPQYKDEAKAAFVRATDIHELYDVD